LSLSILVWLAVNRTAKRWLYPLAIGLHAIIDVPSAMYQAHLLSGMTMTLSLTILLTLLLGAFVAWYVNKLGIHVTVG
jgi:uncharacterized membrane protein YhfC